MLSEKYTQALYKLAKDRYEKDQISFFSNFLEILKRNGHYKLLPKILKNYERIVREDKVKIGIELVISDVKFEDQYKKEIKNYKEYFNIKQSVNVVIDPSIIGGFMIKTKGIVVDASYKRWLIGLYHKFIK
ncbi:MAG: F0F1 ATP synthase subunit delta [Patescibacteria group bacterium]